MDVWTVSHWNNISAWEFSDSTARVLNPGTTQLAKGWHNLPDANCLNDYVMTFDTAFISFRSKGVDPMINWWKRTRLFNFCIFRYWWVLNICTFISQNRSNSELKRRQIWWPNIIKLLVMQHQVSFTLCGSSDCKEEWQTNPDGKRCLHLRCLQTNSSVCWSKKISKNILVIICIWVSAPGQRFSNNISVTYNLCI